jgi:hypothetical protein
MASSVSNSIFNMTFCNCIPTINRMGWLTYDYTRIRNAVACDSSTVHYHFEPWTKGIKLITQARNGIGQLLGSGSTASLLQQYCSLSPPLISRTHTQWCSMEVSLSCHQKGLDSVWQCDQAQMWSAVTSNYSGQEWICSLWMFLIAETPVGTSCATLWWMSL